MRRSMRRLVTVAVAFAFGVFIARHLTPLDLTQYANRSFVEGPLAFMLGMYAASLFYAHFRLVDAVERKKIDADYATMNYGATVLWTAAGPAVWQLPFWFVKEIVAVAIGAVRPLTRLAARRG